MRPHAAEHAVLDALLARRRIPERVAIVVAHPDDETIGAGPLLALFDDLVLVHVTDGAPADNRDAAAHGFASGAGYAASRRAELLAALRAGRVACAHRRHAMLPIPDQTAAHRLPDLVAALAPMLADAATVLTHAFEGGHPDHDAVAFAVARTGRPTIEMAGYHAAPSGGLRTGCFLGDHPSIAVSLGAEEIGRREAMLDRFVTQRDTLAPFRGAAGLRFRIRPAYDWTVPPTPDIHYERHKWGLTAPDWAARVSAMSGRAASTC